MGPGSWPGSILSIRDRRAYLLPLSTQALGPKMMTCAGEPEVPNLKFNQRSGHSLDSFTGGSGPLCLAVGTAALSSHPFPAATSGLRSEVASSA